jgi:trehalose utilization protein
MAANSLTRRSFIALSAAATVSVTRARSLVAAEPAPRAVRVLVWDERQPKQKEAYPNWLGNAIADHLAKQPGFAVRSVALDDPEQRLSEAHLDVADVLVWWGHVRHRDVLPATGDRIVERVRAGKLSLIALHSAHWAMPFVKAMHARAIDDALATLTPEERKSAQVVPIAPIPYRPPKKDDRLTPWHEKRADEKGGLQLAVRLPNCCFPSWRADGKPSHVTVLQPDHPIAAGLPRQFDIPQTEMYCDPFHVPKPDAVLFEEKWDAGESFRSGSIWRLGKGNVFYFRPGHESYAVYREAIPLKVVENACRWLAAEQVR